MPSAGEGRVCDPKRWLECQKFVADTMVSEGWLRISKKFRAVQLKRAVRLYNERY